MILHALRLLAVLTASAAPPSEAAPWVRLLVSEPPTPVESVVRRQLVARLPNHLVKTETAPQNFGVLALEERSAALAPRASEHPASLGVWVDPKERSVRLFVVVAQGGEVRIVEGRNAASATSQLALLAEEILRRHRLAQDPGPSPRTSTSASPVELEAEMGAAVPLSGEAAVGLMLVRASAGIRSGPWRAGGGLEAWPFAGGPNGALGGWGVGPFLRGSYAVVEGFEVGFGAGAVGHVLPVPDGFNPPAPQWALRTAGRVRAATSQGAWRLGLSAEFGAWPLRTELREDRNVVGGLPTFDASFLGSVTWHP